MLFSLDITIDYIILDENVLKIVNKTHKWGKRKKNNFALEYAYVSYKRNSMKTYL
jgi:hypothetical protein